MYICTLKCVSYIAGMIKLKCYLLNSVARLFVHLFISLLFQRETRAFNLSSLFQIRKQQNSNNKTKHEDIKKQIQDTQTQTQNVIKSSVGNQKSVDHCWNKNHFVSQKSSVCIYDVIFSAIWNAKEVNIDSWFNQSVCVCISFNWNETFR